jgi:hypothetical protein
MLEGPTRQDGSDDLVFYDLFQNPMVLVKLECNSLRNALGRPEISNAECQLLGMRHKEILTAIAAVLLEKGEGELRPDGRFRIIKFRIQHLRNIANQLTTDVLAMAAAAHWGGK